jgi:hypothetical protein
MRFIKWEDISAQLLLWDPVSDAELLCCGAATNKLEIPGRFKGSRILFEVLPCMEIILQHSRLAQHRPVGSGHGTLGTKLGLLKMPKHITLCPRFISCNACFFVLDQT